MRASVGALWVGTSTMLLLAGCSSDKPAAAVRATGAADAQAAWAKYVSALKGHDLATARGLTCKAFVDAGNDPSTYADQMAPPSGAGVAVTGGALTVSGAIARARLTFTTGDPNARQQVTGSAVWQVEGGRWQLCEFTR